MATKNRTTISQTPSPKADRVFGSDKNVAESSSTIKKAKTITFTSDTINKIRSKVQKHNKQYPSKKITVPFAKAVVRRGMGAYSTSHRPTITGGKPNSRVAWGLARLNAAIYKIINGKSKSGKYVQDDDLINELNMNTRKKYNIGGMVEHYSSPIIADGMQGLVSKWGGSPITVFKLGGGIEDLKTAKEVSSYVKDSLSKKTFELPLECVVYVPSTTGVNQRISNSEFNSRIEDVKIYLSKLFGGNSTIKVDGGYNSDEVGYVEEDIAKVTAFAQVDSLKNNFDKLYKRILFWGRRWGQESMGFEFEGDLFYISTKENTKKEQSKETKMETGGNMGNSGLAKKIAKRYEQQKANQNKMRNGVAQKFNSVTYYKLPNGKYEVPKDSTQGIEYAIFDQEQGVRDYISENKKYAKGGGIKKGRKGGVSVTKGYRLPHGYKAVKGDDKNKKYATGKKRIRLDAGYRLPHGYEVVEGVYNKKYAGGGGISNREKYDMLVGRVGDEFYFLDDIFRHEDGFKGATGTVVMPVSKGYYEYATSEDGILERYMDAMGEDEWMETLGYSEDDFEDESEKIKAIEDGIYNTYINGGLNPFEEVDYTQEEQLRALPEFASSEEYPVFEVIGGGRIFDKDTKFDKIYDQELYNKIKDVEGFEDGSTMFRRGGLSVTKGYRLPHGYKAVKGDDKNKKYATGKKRIRLDAGYRLPHGYEVVEAAYNMKYGEGGGINELTTEKINAMDKQQVIDLANKMAYHDMIEDGLDGFSNYIEAKSYLQMIIHHS